MIPGRCRDCRRLAYLPPGGGSRCLRCSRLLGPVVLISTGTGGRP